MSKRLLVAIIVCIILMYSNLNVLGQDSTSSSGTDTGGGPPVGGISEDFSGTDTGGGPPVGGISYAGPSDTYPIGELKSIVIQKYVSTRNANYHKNDIVTIKLRVLNYNPTHLESVTITDEVPEGFSFVSANPSNMTSLNPRRLEWECDRIIYDNCFEYSIKTNISDEYTLSSARLKTLIHDNNGRRYTITEYSNLFPLEITNRAPEIKSIYPSRYLQYNYPKRWFNNNDILIRVCVEDPDNDSVFCELQSEDDLELIKPINNPSGPHEVAYNYTWDLSGYKPGLYNFLIKTTDAEGTPAPDEALTLDLYWFIPNKYKSNLVQVILIVAAALIIHNTKDKFSIRGKLKRRKNPVTTPSPKKKSNVENGAHQNEASDTETIEESET